MLCGVPLLTLVPMLVNCVFLFTAGTPQITIGTKSLLD